MIMQDYNKSENYINRELSWLDFNLRVLHEARDKENPLFERLKFLAITSSNLDEFFMVRVASLKNMEISDYKKKDASGLTPHEQLEKISEKTHNMVDMQYSTYEKLLLPQLAVENISILNRNQLSEEQKEFIEKYFKNEIYPVLTPMAVDSSRPFPLIQNKVLNICALIKKENKEQAFATVQIPSVFKRIVKLPSENGKKQFILLEEIVQELSLIHISLVGAENSILTFSSSQALNASSKNLQLNPIKRLSPSSSTGTVSLTCPLPVIQETSILS